MYTNNIYLTVHSKRGALLFNKIYILSEKYILRYDFNILNNYYKFLNLSSEYWDKVEKNKYYLIYNILIRESIIINISVLR